MEQIPKKLQIRPHSNSPFENLGEEIFRVIHQSQSSVSSGLPIDREMFQNITNALVAIANQSWRIAGSLIDPETQEPKSEISIQEIKKIGNALEGIRGVLTELGIAVIDKVGKPYDFGFCEQVVTEKPSANISEDRIIRTIKPTIEWNGTRVQVGSIDIAVAIKKND